MKTPQGTYTIAEAADLWIQSIQSPETKASQAEKDALIAKIKAAVPTTKIIGVGGSSPASEKIDFATACNNIKRTIREGGK